MANVEDVILTIWTMEGGWRCMLVWTYRRGPTNDADRKLAIFLLAGVNNASSRRYREWLVQYDAMKRITRFPHAASGADFRIAL
jgi:hypothetical protein